MPDDRAPKTALEKVLDVADDFLAGCAERDDLEAAVEEAKAVEREIARARASAESSQPASQRPSRAPAVRKQETLTEWREGFFVGVLLATAVITFLRWLG
jgi:hypothetical protein